MRRRQFGVALAIAACNVLLGGSVLAQTPCGDFWHPCNTQPPTSPPAGACVTPSGGPGVLQTVQACVPLTPAPSSSPSPSPSPSPGPDTFPPPPPSPSGQRTPGCLGGTGASFAKLTTPGPDGKTPSSSYFAEFRKSSLHGGQDPDGLDGMDHSLRPGEQGRQTYFFAGLAGDGSAVWGKWWTDTHKTYGAPPSFIYAAMAMDQIKGVRYALVGRSGLCGIYMAEAPDWPSPGPNYLRVGTTSIGPVYARHDAAKADIQRVLTSVHGVPRP